MPERSAPKGTYWRGDTLWGRLTINGREIRWSLRTDDAKAALARYEERKKREIAIAHYGERRPTWEDAYLSWGDHIAANAKPSTVHRYVVSLKQLEPVLRNLYLDEITKDVVGDIIRRRRAAGRPNATIRRDLTALSSVLGYAEEEGWKQDNPALARLKRLKERREPIVLPEHDAIERVATRAPGLLSYMIRAALLTGCRQNELVTLERRQIDKVRRQMALYTTKTSRPRALDLSPEAWALLQSVPVNMTCRNVFWHTAMVEDAAGPERRKRPIGMPYANVASRFRAIVLSAQKSAQEEGVEFRPFRFHDLRHRFAVDYLKERRGGLYDLQQHLGHSSVKVTEMYLDYLTPDEQRSAKDKRAQISAHAQRFDGTEEEVTI